MTRPDTRTHILDAALDLIGHQGIARTSLEDVAVGAGVTRQAVYRHVGSREGLPTQVVLREEQRLLAQLREVVAGHDELRPAREAAIVTALHFARDVVADLLEQWTPHLATPQRAQAAEACTRLIVSYAISPADADPVELSRGLAGLVADGGHRPRP